MARFPRNDRWDMKDCGQATEKYSLCGNCGNKAIPWCSSQLHRFFVDTRNHAVPNTVGDPVESQQKVHQSTTPCFVDKAIRCDLVIELYSILLANGCLLNWGFTTTSTPRTNALGSSDP
ncbi:unnamed protein product [Arabidopsis lyrata]|uniref:Predicted protein n=1 Tax=Arabidopsis lyrata subsp. lyrata TaxID=81972 RepID=D7L0D1_ARALL|nr:predicted protein [Arabidopsis lyrata subsp. lyrata]CAH8259117.1 unnamed protein product [Arabidopsis lyrata]